MEEIKTIRSTARAIIREKGSKFIGVIYPVRDEFSVKAMLQDVRKEFATASHYCYAYRLGKNGERWRVSDDGEPTNSAGKPILGQLQRNDLTQVLLVVVRYFGGTLLGVGGLIQAYREAAAGAIAVAEKDEVRFHAQISFEYALLNQVMRTIKSGGIKILNQQSGNIMQLTISGTTAELELLAAFCRQQGVDFQETE